MSDYVEIFTTYIVNAARDALSRVQQNPGIITDKDRVQAWHLLGYALGVEAAWPQVRQLLLDLAPKMEMAGHREEWLAFLRAGIERSVAQQDVTVQAQLSLAVGLILRLTNEYSEAEEWLNRALLGFQAGQETHGIASVYNQMGRIRYLQHRDEEAVQFAHNALELLADGDPERAESHFVLGMAALNQRQWERAEQSHRLSLAIRQQSGDPRTIAWAMQNVGTVLTQQSEYGGVDRLTEAARWLEQAVILLDNLPDPFHSAVACNSLALVHFQRGESEKATRLLCQAEIVFQTTHSPEWRARVLNNLGLVYLQSGQPVEAEKTFRSAVAIYAHLGDDADRLNSQHGIVLTLLAQQRFTEAAALCQQGLAELDALKDAPAQYAEKENWYRSSLAQAQASLRA